MRRRILLQFHENVGIVLIKEHESLRHRELGLSFDGHFFRTMNPMKRPKHLNYVLRLWIRIGVRWLRLTRLG